jgi:hypothetical protein
MCGMAKLSDDIAFNLPGGSSLNARYVRDPQHPFHLSPDAQDVRFIGHSGHAKTMKQLGSTCKIVVGHGTEDATCPAADAREMVSNLREAGLDVESTWVSPDILDGKVFTSAGHALGNRTEIVFRVAEQHLRPDSPTALRRSGPTDFERRDSLVRYQTPNGAYVTSFEAGHPVGRFEANGGR